MQLPFIQAPVRPEAPESRSPSSKPANNPGSADAFFATCMDHALTEASPEEQAADGKEGEGEANFAQQPPSSSPSTLLLEAVALQLLASTPSPAPQPPLALLANPQTGNRTEAVIPTSEAASEAAPGAPNSLPLPGETPAVALPTSPVQALQTLQPGSEAASNPAPSSLTVGAPESPPCSRSLQAAPDSQPRSENAQASQSGAAPGKDSSPAQPIPPEAGLSTPVLPPTAAGLKAPAPALNQGPLASNHLHPPAPAEALSAESGAPAEAVGTAAAQQPVSMKKAEKMPKSADLAQQKLPGAVVLPEARQELTGLANPAERLASAVFSTVPVAGAMALSPDTTAASIPLVAPDARLHALEHTQDLVALHAVRLRESGAESLRVLLEPGAGLNLSLELRWREGHIEAQATLHRGDFAYLNQHWADLQQHLEPRGVHLASLESALSYGSGSEQFSQSPRQFAHEDSGASAFADYAFGDSMTDSPAARRSRSSSAHRGWETWA